MAKRRGTAAAGLDECRQVTDTDQVIRNELGCTRRNITPHWDEPAGNWQARGEIQRGLTMPIQQLMPAWLDEVCCFQPHLDGISQNMADMLTTGKANWADFTRSIVVDADADPDEAGHGCVRSVPPTLLRWALLAVVIPGPAVSMSLPGVVHRGEFVSTQEATNRIGVGNLYLHDARLCDWWSVVGVAVALLSFGVSVYAPVLAYRQAGDSWSAERKRRCAGKSPSAGDRNEFHQDGITRRS